MLPVVAGAQAVSAESATAIDAASGKVLWSRNADEPLYPASTTKIMTALLLLEKCKPDEVITAPEDVESVKEATMHLKPGERIRAKDMLYALMLRSANDGCYAVACHIAGSVPKFSDLMNERAKELGCTHTHFDNPNGLNDPMHYTTAHDLALIAREAMKHPEFREAVGTERIKINRGTNWKDLVMVNHNKILFHDPSCDGIKTGWTIPAGHCFVGSAERDGWRVITVVLKSKHWQNDTEGLFNWAYASFQRKQEVAAGQVVCQAKVQGGVAGQVPVQAAEDAYSLVGRTPSAAPTTMIEVPDKLTAPISRLQRLGDMIIRDPDGFERKVDLVASQDVASASPIIPPGGPGSSRLWLGGGVVVGAIVYRGTTRKRVRRRFK